MSIGDLPVLNALRTKMQWHQERQRVLADNVANSDTPNFRPRDLVPVDPGRPMAVASAVTLARTDPMHLTLNGSTGSAFEAARSGSYETRPAGNAVNLEDEMIKVAANQMDYQMVTTLYSRGLGLIKTALGKQ